MKVVGVVGIGHVPGIVKLWPHSQTNVEAIMKIPPPTLTSKLIKVSFKLSFISLSGYLIYKYVPGTKSLTNSVFNICSNTIQNIAKYAKSS